MTRQFDLTTPIGRLTTLSHYAWNDHAYLRLGFSNAHWISDELVRANQPWPFQVKAWRDRGIRTIVNLRGGDDSHHVLEQEACDPLRAQAGQLPSPLARGAEPRAGAGRAGAVRRPRIPGDDALQVRRGPGRR